MSAEQVSQVRSTLPVQARHIDAKQVELAVFRVRGRRDLGLQLWDDARIAAEGAWRTCRRRMHREYGARSPHGGWAAIVLFVGLLAAAVGALLASGARTDPADTVGAVAALVAGVGAVDLVVLLAAGVRPWNRALARMQVGLGVALAVAAAFHLSRPVTAVTPFVLAGAAVGIAGALSVVIVRATRPAQRLEIDTVINVAVARMQPEVDATARRLLGEVAAALGDEESRRIVELRDVVLQDLAAEGIALDPLPADVPAGGAIVSGLLANWHPYAKSAAVRG